MSCKFLDSLRSSASSCEYLVSFSRLETHPNVAMLKLLADGSPSQNALKHKLSHSLLQEVSATFQENFLMPIVVTFQYHYSKNTCRLVAPNIPLQRKMNTLDDSMALFLSTLRLHLHPVEEERKCVAVLSQLVALPLLDKISYIFLNKYSFIV